MEYFCVPIPFKKLDKRELAPGMTVYYTIDRQDKDNVLGPFMVTFSEALGGLCLKNAQDVQLSMKTFQRVTFYQPLREDLASRELEYLRTAIRKHRDQRGDDRCWLDDEELYKALPEGYTPPERDESVELQLCQKFIASRHNPAVNYVSPQRRIEELEQEILQLQIRLETSGAAP